MNVKVAHKLAKHYIMVLIAYGRRHSQLQIEFINPSKPDGIPHSYQMDKSISVSRVVGRYLSFLFEANSGEPDQTPRSVASGLVLHCLTMPQVYMG